MDAFGRVAAIIFAAVLVFLLPIKYIAVNRNAALQMQIHTETVRFADEIMVQGYLTKDMYNAYINELDRTGELYDIEIIHGKPTEGYKIVDANHSKKYLQCAYTETILKEVYTSGVYYFEEGDFITIRVTSKSTSYLQKLQHMFNLITVVPFKYSYGGQVHG